MEAAGYPPQGEARALAPADAWAAAAAPTDAAWQDVPADSRHCTCAVTRFLLQPRCLYNP